MNGDRQFRSILLLVIGMTIAVPAVGAARAKAHPTVPIQGRWVAGPIPLNHGNAIGVNPWCRLYARNLNQFRTLSFSTCNARLSKKYPEFQRPHWTKIPWDRALAKKVFTVGPYPHSPGYEQGWRHWLAQTRALRRAGKVHLWRASVDLLGNGQKETLIRLDHVSRSEVIRGGRVVGSRGPYCRHIDSKLYLLPSPDPTLARVFNTYGGLFNDVLYDTETKHYFLLDWEHYPTPGKFFRVAAGSIIVSAFNGTASCYINWIPVHPRQTVKGSTHATKTYFTH